jgi:hypothetical protein
MKMLAMYMHGACSKNASMYGIAFATNELGDIYLVGRLPLGAVNEDRAR